MVSEKFRRQLRQQAEGWQQDGLIDAMQYQQLAARYQFDELEVRARNRFVMILLGIGSILLALGAVTFVAANWQEWPHGFKLGLLLSLLVLANFSGFGLWRNPNRSGKRRRFGQGLLLLGALLVGPCIAQMAQMFHIGGSPYALLLCWGLAVLVMAYSLRLTFLGIVAGGLVLSGYLWGIPELSVAGSLSWSQGLVRHMPLLSMVLFGPLAYYCRSRVLFALEALLLVGALETNIGYGFDLAPGVLIAIAPTLPVALLWAYDDCIWPGINAKRFQPTARVLALLCFCISLYTFTFNHFWDFSVLQESWVPNQLPDWWLLLDLAMLEVLTVVLWTRLICRRGNLDRVTVTLGSMVAIATLLLFCHHNWVPIPILATFLFNSLFFLLAAGLMRSGLATGKRYTFWSGILLLALQILSRLLEYDTDLLLKSFVFFLCGVGVIAAGLWFEKHLSTLVPTQEFSP